MCPCKAVAGQAMLMTYIFIHLQCLIVPFAVCDSSICWQLKMCSDSSAGTSSVTHAFRAGHASPSTPNPKPVLHPPFQTLNAVHTLHLSC